MIMRWISEVPAKIRLPAKASGLRHPLEAIAGLPAATGVRVAVLRFGCLLPAGGCGGGGLCAL